MDALSNIHLKRRTLLKGLGVVGLSSLVPTFLTLRQANGSPLPRVRLKQTDYQTFRSTCAMECLHCNLTAYVWKDRLMKIEATKGFNVKCCLRGISRTKWVYHPLRLTKPLLRIGEKGEGNFSRLAGMLRWISLKRTSGKPLPLREIRAYCSPPLRGTWILSRMIWAKPSSIISVAALKPPVRYAVRR